MKNLWTKFGSGAAAFIFLGLMLPTALVWSQTLLPTKLVLNWKAEPEFGGFYAAEVIGSYKKHGLKVEILEGGAGMPSTQMVAAGQADFGIAGADEVIINRAKGGDVVALFATYQSSPHAILTHAERGFNSLADVYNSEGLLALQKGLPFAVFLANKFPKPKVKIVPYLGGVANFLSDKTFSQQGFVTIEALEAEKQGAQVKSFLVAAEGFDPYLAVLITRRKLLETKPELVRGMVRSVREGWAEYLKNPAATNQLMSQMNRTISMEILRQGAEVQKPFIETSETKAHGLGHMTEARWQTLTQQLLQLKLIKKAPEAKANFVMISP